MDIDDFLDSEESGDKKPVEEEIQIGNEPEESSVGDKEIDLSEEEGDSSDEVMDLNSMNTVENKPKTVIEKPASNSFKDKFIFFVNQVKKSVSKNNLVDAMKYLKDLVALTNKIPTDKTDVRHKANNVILSLNNKILGKAKELRKDFDSHAMLINKLLAKVKIEIANSNIKKVVSLYQQIMSVYKALSDDFSEEKLALNDKILKLQSIMNDLKLKDTDRRFEEQRVKIVQMAKEIDNLVAENNLSSAEQKYKDVQDLFWQLPEDHYEERLKLHEAILKKKNAMDLSNQITSLQNELKTSNPNTVKQKVVQEVVNKKSVMRKSVPPLPKVEVTPPPPKKVVPELMPRPKPAVDVPKAKAEDVKYVQKFESEKLSEPPKKTTPVNHESVSPVRPLMSKKTPTRNPLSMKPEPVKAPSKMDNDSGAVDDALKKISIAKAKIEIVEGNYESANELLNQLIAKYPGDAEVEKLKSQITEADNKPTSYSKVGSRFERKLDNIENDLEKGDTDKALEDTEIAEQSSAYKDVIDKAGVDLEKSAKSIADAIVHKRIKTARDFLEAGNKEEAKRNLERALKIDPLNKEAKMLMGEVN